ncbi:MAG: hypothetical protein M1834_004221 [Cirrosporium novae-zelandiae]|nr:MAG: hypothetical protein M1834_004221 [Cirrosporium novae-zelandiae]
MNRQIEECLRSLLPAQSSNIPPELLDLAQSLLAQSRSRVSTLKSDEEIARPHVCAHLACERLKRSLNLSKIVSKPPCKPRIYNQLYKYLDSTLAVKPRSARLSAPSTPVKQTPKRGPLQAASKTFTPSGRKKADRKHTEAPDWVMPMVRRVCGKHGEAFPHIWVGISEILGNTDYQDLENKESRNSKIRALMVALYVVVERRLSGKDKDQAENRNYEKLKYRLLKAMDGEDSAETKAQLDDLYQCESEFVDDWMKQLVAMDLNQMEWFGNVPQGIHSTDDIAKDGSGENRYDQEATIPSRKKAKFGQANLAEGILLPGLGTMMQDRVDYLSDDRRADYLEWKSEVVARIDEIEKTAMTAPAKKRTKRVSTRS